MPERDHLAQLDVLRGLAVLAVVAFHARLPWSSSGFVGVDVFFVLSGFLITRLLVRELEASGTIALRAFEARRVRRLWPALALVVVCTLALGIALWSPLEWRGLRHDAAAGAGYVANISFALRKVAYFDQPEEAPFLHLWSLGVEEQFYLLWPCVLLTAWYVARRCRIDRRRTLAATIATLGTLSLAWMIWLVQRRSSYAFFFTPTRMWELALGGLIGLRAVDPPPRGRRGWLYGLIGCAVFAAPLAFPGARSGDPLIQSIAPVIGTAFLLEAIRLGSRLPLPGAAAAGLAWIGLYSYGWYLWHWPLVEATKLRWHTQDPRYLLGASLLALLIAVGSKRWIEDPVRFRQADSLLGRLPTWVVIAGIVTIVSAALAGAALMEHQALKNPRVRALADIRQAVDAPTIAARCPRSVFEAPCILGDTASPGVVVVAGDSHAEHWLPAVDSAARVLGLRIVTHIKAACPPWPVRVRHFYDSFEDLECDQHQARLVGLIAGYRAGGVILASTVGDVDRMVGDLSPGDRARLWRESAERLIADLPLTVRIVIVEKSPHLGFDPVSCLARSAFWQIAPACDENYGTATGMELEYTRLEAAAGAGDSRVQVFPTVADLCAGTSCNALRGDMVVFRDRFHLTPRYALSQVPRWLHCLRWAGHLESGDSTPGGCSM